MNVIADVWCPSNHYFLKNVFLLHNVHHTIRKDLKAFLLKLRMVRIGFSKYLLLAFGTLSVVYILKISTMVEAGKHS